MIALLIALAMPCGAFAQGAQPEVAVPITYSFNYDSSLSPDGKRMVFLKVLEGREQMFLADSDGANERQLTRAPVDHEDPAWSPDGTQIAYIRIAAGKKALHVIDADGARSAADAAPDPDPPGVDATARDPLLH